MIPSARCGRPSDPTLLGRIAATRAQGIGPERSAQPPPQCVDPRPPHSSSYRSRNDS
ncbi:DUF6053 domain-containing protein [Lysobacter enzymogenes]|uniref:DUF6053 domain-containing protein n=1 Tax=Lysobacter enzymogenes TaxID=69 RepID=UPI00384AF96E